MRPDTDEPKPVDDYIRERERRSDFKPTEVDDPAVPTLPVDNATKLEAIKRDALSDRMIERMGKVPLGAVTTKYGARAVHDVTGQLREPRRHTPKGILAERRDRHTAVANMAAEWVANNDNTSKVKSKRLCENCDAPLPYRMPITAKYCPGGKCRTEAHRKKIAEVERDRVFQTAEAIAREAADNAQRLFSYREVALEMQQSAHRIGRDDAIFLATSSGVLSINEGKPLPPIRVTVHSAGVPARRVEMRQAGDNWTTMHPDAVEFMDGVTFVEPIERSVLPRVAAIPRSSWELRGTELEEHAKRIADLAMLQDLRAGPERRVMLYTIDDAAYVPDPEQKSLWAFRFKGDPGLCEGDDYEGAWPEQTPEQEVRQKNRLDFLAWLERHENRPQYTHAGRLERPWGRDATEFAFGDSRRVDSGQRKPKVEHLFEES